MKSSLFDRQIKWNRSWNSVIVSAGILIASAIEQFVPSVHRTYLRFKWRKNLDHLTYSGKSSQTRTLTPISYRDWLFTNSLTNWLAGAVQLKLMSVTWPRPKRSHDNIYNSFSRQTIAVRVCNFKSKQESNDDRTYPLLFGHATRARAQMRKMVEWPPFISVLQHFKLGANSHFGCFINFGAVLPKSILIRGDRDGLAQLRRNGHARTISGNPNLSKMS